MFEFFKWVFIKEAILHAIGCVGVALIYIGMILFAWALIEFLIYFAKDRKDRKK